MRHALLSLSCLAVLAQPTAPDVTKLEGFKDVFRHRYTFIAGQPNLELLRELKRQGVTLVVNVRDEKETKDHAAIAYGEEATVKELGMAYLWLPLGDRAAYVPTVLERLKAALQAHPGKVLIHCTVGGRATTVYMAHLVRHQGLSLDQAAQVGRRMKFTFPMEDLLGIPVSFQASPPAPR